MGSEETAEPVPHTIGSMIKAARKRAGMSHNELGERVGYCEDRTSSIERGWRAPQPEFLIAADETTRVRWVADGRAEDVERAKKRILTRWPPPLVSFTIEESVLQ